MLQNAGNVENASCFSLFPIGVNETALQYAGNVENASFVNLFPTDVDEVTLCCRTMAMLKMFHLSVFSR